MAILGSHKGSWLGLPDFGITEKASDLLGRGRTNQGGSNLLGSQAPAYQAPQQNFSQETNPRLSSSGGGQVLGASTGGGGSYNAAGQTAPQQPTPQQAPAPQPGGGSGPSELDVINQEFDAFSSFLNDQSGLAQQNFANAESAILADKQQGLDKVKGERQLRSQELDQTATEGRQNERLNLQRVRQLLQDLEQRNAARLAITGGGSLSDALADRFGRTAQQSVGGVLQEGQRFQNDVAMEAERANQFYDQKKAEIESQAANQIAEARTRLNQNLSAIEGERRASAAEKQRARLDSWKNYYNQVNQARVQAANFAVQYDMWKRQLDAQLAAAQGYQASDISGQNFDPSIAYAQQGLNIGSIPSGVGANPQFAATMFNPGASPDQSEEDYLQGLQ